jgi:hypothetical protein
MRNAAAAVALALAVLAGLLAHDLRAHGEHTLLPGEVSARVLDLGPQRRLRAAIGLYERRSPAARRALAAAAAGDEPQRASQAYDLLALLDYRTRTTAGADRAIADLRTAIRLDPTNEDAKANLELVLRLLDAVGVRPGSAAAAGPRAGGARGAGSATRGGGY